uniref:Bm10646 n=1 Tax=Brugia malayi TaxID=6279 RepID=A0A0H5SAB2_BRUMA|nr:Bm10646 [Brugia malayi]
MSQVDNVAVNSSSLTGWFALGTIFWWDELLKLTEAKLNMYTELKELINFLAIYMHHRIPRRRICLFMESYSNHLAGRFLGKWKPEEPEYGEKERTLMIKAGDCLDQILSTIATSIGIVEEDLAACFPYGIAFFCETPAILYNVLNSNGNVMDKTKYPFYFVPKNKELKSQRCILLQLISSMDDYAYDLVWSGFLFENENTTTDNERTVLNGLLRIGYINETVLPWNSGRPLLIRYIWGINTNNGNEIFAFEVL